MNKRVVDYGCVLEITRENDFIDTFPLKGNKVKENVQVYFCKSILKHCEIWKKNLKWEKFHLLKHNLSLKTLKILKTSQTKKGRTLKIKL